MTDIGQPEFLFLSVVILLVGYQVWLFRWILILLAVIFKGVLIFLLLSLMVGLSLSHWYICILIRDPSILITHAIHLLKYGDSKYCDTNPRFSRNVHSNFLMTLFHIFPGFIRQAPLDYIIPVVYGSLDKSCELFVGHLLCILPIYIVSSWLTRFIILHIPMGRTGISYCLEFKFALQLLTALPNLCINFLNSGGRINHINNIKCGNIVNILDVILKEWSSSWNCWVVAPDLSTNLWIHHICWLIIVPPLKVGRLDWGE